MAGEHLHFVTGKLAEHALRPLVAQLSAQLGFAHSIDVLPITVAALMTPAWVARHVRVPPAATRVILPGYCEGDLTPLQAMTSARVERGPRDLRDLGEYLGGSPRRSRLRSCQITTDYGSEKRPDRPTCGKTWRSRKMPFQDRSATNARAF